MKLIEIKNLNKIYHTPTKEVISLNNINLTINKEEIISIVGTSGCGKSTLLNILTKLLTPSSGTIIEHEELRIGYMMQEDALLPWLNVYENCILGLKLQHKLTNESKQYVDKLLEKYELIEFKNEYPNNLSGGMRQRVALIRTLAIKPNILLLDEPFSKLDIDSRINISDDVYKIIKELKITTILITHDISEAITLSDRIIVLTSRPGTIKNRYLINFDEDTPSKKRNTNYFNLLYKTIWSDIFNE